MPDIRAYIDATAGFTDGTLVSVEGANTLPIPFAAIGASVPVALRCTTGYEAPGAVTITAPTLFEVSAGGETWGSTCELASVSDTNAALFVRQRNAIPNGSSPYALLHIDYGAALIDIPVIKFVAMGTPTEIAAEQSGSFTLSKPAGVVEGDIMFATINKRGNSSEPACSGWSRTEAGAVGGIYSVMYKVAGASEPSTYTFTYTAGFASIQAAIYAWRGQAATGFIHDVSYAAYTTNDTILRAASIVTTVPTTILFFGMSRTYPGTGTGTEPAGYTARYNHNYADVNLLQLVADYKWESWGTAGNIDATLPSALTDKMAFAVALKAAS